MKNENCVFCKIVAGEIPSYKVYEDQNFYGFLNIKPQSKGHTLLIPKEHFEDVLAIPTDLYLKYLETGKILAEKIKKLFEPKRVAFIFAGLEVSHTHLHIYALNENEELNPHHAKDADFSELAETQKMFI